MTAARIDAVWAFLMADTDGSEKFCAVKRPDDTSVMLIAPSNDEIAHFRPIAEAISNETAKPIRLVKFNGREDVDVFTPE
jgi:hypothetical protein